MAHRRLHLLRPEAPGSAGAGTGIDELDATVEPPARAVPKVPEPTPFTESDVVPAFRADLTIERGDPGLFDVADPNTGRRFALYEFELTIARMLDGRRRASDVVESGLRLGIPVDIQGLYKFARQLWHYGFLAAPGVERAPGLDERGDWPGRARWDEATRTLFQTGLRLMRQGRPGDASSYFEAVLGADPENPEAGELLAAIGRGESLTAAPIGHHTLPRTAGAPPAQARSRSSRMVLAAGAIALAAVAGVAWLLGRAAGDRPLPERVRAVGPIAIDSGAPADARTAPATAPASATPARASWRSAPVSRKWRPVRAQILAPAGGSVVWSRERDARVGADERIGFIRVEPRKWGGDARADRHIAELERLAAQDPVYREFLEKARRDRRRRLERTTRRVPLAAPATGGLSPVVASGVRRPKGALLGSIVDVDVWHLSSQVAGAAPPPDATCEIQGDAPGDRAPCALVASSGGAPGEPTEVTVSVRAALVPWLASARSPEVRLPPEAALDPPAAGATR